MNNDFDETTLSLDYEFKRYHDLLEHVRAIAINKAKLSHKERELFFQGIEAYFIQEKKTLKIINDIAKKPKQKFAGPLKVAKKRISTEIVDFYKKVNQFVSETLLPNSEDAWASIEYRRFACYISTLVYPYMTSEEKTPSRGKTLESFNQALYLAKTALKPWDELNCELVLNYSTFQYICFGNIQEAVKICQNILYDIQKAQEPPILTSKTKRIMQAMIANITAWSNVEE